MPGIVLIALDWEERALLRAQLEAEGYEVTGVPGLDEALFKLPDLRPDLVVFATRRQPLDADSLASLRRAAGSAPILVLTGPYDVTLADLRAQGFDRLLVRPFFIKDVVAAVRAALPPNRRRGDGVTG